MSAEDLELKKNILDILKRVKKTPKTNFGICFNVKDRLSNFSTKVEEILVDIFLKWPDCAMFEGKKDTQFPVERSFDRYAKSKAHGTLWKNPRRLTLLDFMIETLEIELESENECTSK